MEFEFAAPIVYWRGPTPWYFVEVPPELSAMVKERANEFTFGWGMIPGIVTVKKVRWYTAFFEKDGVYMVPVKAAVRRKAKVDVDDLVTVRVELGGDYTVWMRDPKLRVD